MDLQAGALGFLPEPSSSMLGMVWQYDVRTRVQAGSMQLEHTPLLRHLV